MFRSLRDQKFCCFNAFYMTVPVSETGINNGKLFKQLKTPFILLMMVNNAENKLFPNR